MAIDLDEIDRRILSFLIKDGRISLIDISKNLMKFGISISAPSIKRRVSQLIDSGIIKKFGVVLDYDKLGIPSLAFINLKVEPSAVSRVAKSISYLPEVREAHIIQDDYNLLVSVQCANYKDISRLIERFSSSRNILDTKTSVVLDSFSGINSASQLLKEADVLMVDIDRDGEDEAVLDNPVLSVVVKPKLCGRVAEIVLKETGNDQVKRGDGFLLDNFAEEGWGRLANLPCDCEILENNDKLVKVKFTGLFKGSKIEDILLEKKLTLPSDSAVIRVDYRIVNKAKKRQKVTLWVSNYVAAGGDIDEADCFFLPIEGKMESELYKRQSYHVMWPVSRPETLGEDASYYITIEQPEIRERRISDGWAAWMDTRSEEIVGFFWSRDEVAYIKRCYLLNSYSFEVIYSTVDLDPGQSKDYLIFMLIGKGGQDLVWQRNDELRKEFL